MNLQAERINILLVEDDYQLRPLYEKSLARHGFDVRGVPSIAAARELLDQAPADVLLVDFGLPDGTGPELVRWALSYDRARAAYCMTGLASCNNVVEAMRAGCGDVFEKPFDLQRFAQIVTLRHAAFVSELSDLNAWRRRFVPELVGNHPRILEVLRIVHNIAETNSTVLITGESGTGKELIAQAIHRASSRRDQPFVAINCAAIPGNLIEDELFGHVKGAFTNALNARDGLIAAANGGTLFLDEIGDMPMDAQGKLLRVLQDRLVTPVGSDRAVPIDVRVIAASNKRLEEEVERERFRGDLYFRLSVIPVKLPALSERKEDILPIAGHFLARAAAETHRRVPGFEPAAEQALLEHNWTGNVRELANAVERAVVMKQCDGLITEAELMLVGRSRTRSTVENLNLKRRIDQVERELITEALELTGGNKTEAASLLGLNRTTLVEKIRKFA